MNSFPRNYRTSGFTLVELLVASAVLVLTASGVYAAVNLQTWMLISSRYHLEAQSLAVDNAWIVYRDSYSDLLTYPAVGTASVPATHLLFNRGGTLRTSVATYTDHVTITSRVDWVEKNSRSAFESFSVDRYDDR